ncbi:flippase [Rubrivirga sp.]|uniref:flippase n=1 Tax=Rubrivirga sp. TaxID=1885344 RepID=UPI003C782933
MSQNSRLAKNVVVLGLAQGATLLFGFISWVHFGRSLGAERLGMLAFGMALVAYFVLAVALGFDAVGVREVARSADREKEIVPNLLGVRLVLAFVATVVFVGLAEVLGLEPIYKNAVLVLSGLILARAIQLDWVYQAREQMGKVSARNTAAAGVTALIALAFVRGPEDLAIAAAALAAGPFVANLVLLAVYALEVGVPRPQFERAAWKALLAPALPLAASSLVSQFYYNADKLMLEAFRATAEVGLYEVAYKLYAIAVAPAGVLYLAFYPALSSAFEDRDAMVQESRRYGGIQFVLGLPLALAGVVLAPDLVELVFGAEYLGASTALRILFAYAGLSYVSMTFGVPLMAWNDEKGYMRSVLGGGVANVILNVSLIIPFGLVGAAIATIASEAIVTVGMAVRYRRLTGTLLPATLARGAVVGAVGGIAPAVLGLWLGLPIFGTLALVALATGLAGWASGLVDPRMLIAILTRRP